MSRAQAQLIETALNVRGAGAVEAGELAFVARLLAQATLPHSDPGDVGSFTRRNGALQMFVQPTPGVGVPYGSYPRLVLAWLTTEAVRTKSPRVVMGDSLSAFMGELGIVPTGGRWGTITRLRDQMRRLFSSRIGVQYDDDATGFQARQMLVAEEVDLWWSPRDPDQAAVFESVVVLGRTFFEAVTERPVPVDMRVLRALKKSPLGLDLYTWLTYRVSYAREPFAVTWPGPPRAVRGRLRGLEGFQAEGETGAQEDPPPLARTPGRDTAGPARRLPFPAPGPPPLAGAASRWRTPLMEPAPPVYPRIIGPPPPTHYRSPPPRIIGPPSYMTPCKSSCNQSGAHCGKR